MKIWERKTFPDTVLTESHPPGKVLEDLNDFYGYLVEVGSTEDEYVGPRAIIGLVDDFGATCGSSHLGELL